MQRTIKWVNPQIGEWSSSYGVMKSVRGNFEDGDGWSINCKPGNEEKTKAALEALIGKPLEGYTVEPSMDKNLGEQRKFNGKLQWNLKAVQPAQGGFRGGGGGGGGSKESWSYSKEGAEAKAREIAASVALQQSVAFHAVTKIATPEVVCDTARKFFGLLVELSGAGGTAADPLASFEKSIEAANQARKESGFKPIDALTLAEAVALRQWPNTGFKTRPEFVKMLGPERVKKLEGDMDANPTKFEKEYRP